MPLQELTDGKTVTIYGQTEITRDLTEARAAAGAAAFYEAEDVILEDFETTHPRAMDPARYAARACL